MEGKVMSDEQINAEAPGPTSEVERAAQKREAASEAPHPEQGFIDALIQERHRYVVHGRTDGVAEVDEQLRLRGVEPPADVTGDGKTTATRRGRGRGRTTKA